MIAFKITLLSGRYHSTPWGRNVNEGIPEFPPSPYRIVRAIIDSWLRKRPSWDIDILQTIIEKLSENPPLFSTPRFTEGVILSYMSQNSKEITKKQLIYDGFISINPEDQIYVIWKNVEFTEIEVQKLEEILSLINYLGRSDSWVKIETLKDFKEFGDKINVEPLQDLNYFDGNKEKVKVAIPIAKKNYKYEKTEWFDALMLKTSDIIYKGISSPYALEFTYYLIENPEIKEDKSKKSLAGRLKVKNFLYSIDSKVPPMATDSLIIAERIHKKINGIYGKMSNNGRSVNLSGINPDGSISKGHRHIFILPLDLNNNGRISHILIRNKEYFTQKELLALDRTRSIWQSNGRPDIKLIPKEWGEDNEISVIQKSKRFKSITPVVLTRHYRKGRGDYYQWLCNELNHEFANHGLPKPVSFKLLNKSSKNGHSYYWLDFRRNRKNDPVNLGYGFEVVFEDYVPGPFSVGYGAHFGLGTFMPVKEVMEGDRE